MLAQPDLSKEMEFPSRTDCSRGTSFRRSQYGQDHSDLIHSSHFHHYDGIFMMPGVESEEFPYLDSFPFRTMKCMTG